MGSDDWRGDETLDPQGHIPSEFIHGTFADYAIVPKRNAIPLPKGISPRHASVLGTAWLPTLCAIIGAKINANDFDGEGASAAWLGNSTPIRTKPLLWKSSSPNNESLIRDGQWKIHRPTRKNDGELEFYDLTADPAESNNLTARHPDMVKRRSAKLEDWVAKLPKEYLKTKDKDD